MGKWTERFQAEWEKNRPVTIATNETKGSQAKSIVSNVAIVTGTNSQNRDSLEKKLAFLQEQYRACLNVQKSPEYRTFSEITLKYEAEAFERLEKQIREIQKTLSLKRE